MYVCVYVYVCIAVTLPVQIRVYLQSHHPALATGPTARTGRLPGAPRAVRTIASPPGRATRSTASRGL